MVFGQLLFNQNLLAQKEWDLFRSVADMFTWEPDAIIYIACPPEVCLERMRARARPAEAHVTLEYLHKIDFMYTHMLKYFSGRVIQVDGSRPLADVYSDVAAAVLQLRGEQQACGGPSSGCSSSATQ
jgi:thymidylate kinase